MLRGRTILRVALTGAYLTDDEDPAIGDKIREIHRSRFENDPALLGLIKDLGSYKGSGVPDDGATSA